MARVASSHPLKKGQLPDSRYDKQMADGPLPTKPNIYNIYSRQHKTENHRGTINVDIQTSPSLMPHFDILRMSHSLSTDMSHSHPNATILGKF